MGDRATLKEWLKERRITEIELLVPSENPGSPAPAGPAAG